MTDGSKTTNNYTVKILDFRYKYKFNFLAFRYIYYRVEAKNQSGALKKAKSLYMKGESGERSESLPILLEIFSVEDRPFNPRLD